MRLNLAHVGVENQVTYCSDGLIAIDTAIKMLTTAMMRDVTNPIRPISIMLLDF